MIFKTKFCSARWIIKGTGSNFSEFEPVPLIIPLGALTNASQKVNIPAPQL
jgi:hypothetical protein